MCVYDTILKIEYISNIQRMQDNHEKLTSAMIEP